MSGFVERRLFGRIDRGQREVEALHFGTADGVQVEVLTYGAILRRLSFPVRGVRRDVILNFDHIDDYVRDRAYVGPIVGRFGNRIAGAVFELDGKRQTLTANENGNHLHGGSLGLSKRLWRVLEVAAAPQPRVVLGYHSPTGEEGYPGAMEITVELVARPDALLIALGARCNAASPVNLTYHPYFNISGDRHAPATEQWLRIPADHYLPVAAGLIPTGELAPVDGTPFDFRVARRLAPPDVHADPQLGVAGGYDHCWVLADGADCACELTSPQRDLTLTMLGSGPGLQFYSGQFLVLTHDTLGSGIILEPQGFPNAPNEPRFPNSILRPGENYRAAIEYRFGA